MRLHAIDLEISMGFISDERHNNAHLDALMAFGLFCNNCSLTFAMSLNGLKNLHL